MKNIIIEYLLHTYYDIAKFLSPYMFSRYDIYVLLAKYQIMWIIIDGYRYNYVRDDTFKTAAVPYAVYSKDTELDTYWELFCTIFLSISESTLLGTDFLTAAIVY